MTPQEVIQRARGHFGEDTALTVQDVTFREWVTDALRELYNDLPAEEVRPLITEESVSLDTDADSVGDGRGTIPDTWDRVLNVKIDGVPALRQRPETIRHIDSNQFFAPTQKVWALLDKTLLVRPKGDLSVMVTHQDPPTKITATTETNEITEVNKRWHIALVHLVASYAYQQEEDHESAAAYKRRYQDLVRAAWRAAGQPIDGEGEDA